VEVWNLVFPQFFQEADGTLGTLERKGVDTGMGLERLAMVSQGVETTYDTDLVRPIIDFVKDEAGADPGNPSHEIAARVISDHARALCFAINEGVLPSNEGRGYVIRRILRRAVVKALDLGFEGAFLFKVAGRVIDIMRTAHPDLADNQEKIALIIKSDEERFEKTLSRGMAIFRDSMDEVGAKERGVIPGEVVFKLYDTYGFPVEITRELASAHGLTIDKEGFEKEMEAQRERARQASKIGGDQEAADEMGRAPAAFVGYESLEVPTVIAAIKHDGGNLESASKGMKVRIELERTPFYPEGGGQVSDVGTLAGNTGRGVVEAVQWLGGDSISHTVLVEAGDLRVGEGVVAKVDVPRRKSTQRNHTATHLLHNALRSVLGGHVRQSGSHVAPDRLRFDFTHYEPLSEDEVRKIEDMVNCKIMDNLPVASSLEAFETAKERGAIALFGDKYGQEVRVISIEETSCELCGGTHVGSTGEIGGFRVQSESGIAAGIRRIEALTGFAVIEAGRTAEAELRRVASTIRVPVHDIEDGARKAMDRVKRLEKETSQLRERLAGSEIDDILGKVSDAAGVKVIASRVDVPDIQLLKKLADQVKDRTPDAVVCVGSASGDKVFIVVSVAPSLVKDKGIKASAIAKKLGELVGGKGGGKDVFAQAGGKHADKLDSALEQCSEVVAAFVR
jgi:alanyl-tRNA synthetase